MIHPDISAYLRETQEFLQDELKTTLNAHNKSQALHEAMSYSLLKGGKGLRASLCLMTCEALGSEKSKALSAAISLECIHTYSLIHDDLPAMDDDDMRRGKLSNHKVHGEAMAILAGDGLQSLAFLKISESYDSDLAQRLGNLLSSAALKMAAGQSLDIMNNSFSEEADLENMHRLKTGALIKAAVLMGAACAGLEESNKKWENLERYSKKIGLAFQISDDILDVTTSSVQLGKTSGKDQLNEKTTYVSLLGLKRAKEKLSQTLQEANQALDSFSESVKMLRAASEFIKNRDH